MKHFKTFIGDSICINALNDTVIPDEQSFTDTALLLVGLINRVYERDNSVPFRVDFPNHDHNDLFYDENMFKRYLEIMLHHT